MELIKDYLRNGNLLIDFDDAIKVKRRAVDYVLDGNDLYRVRGRKKTLRYIDHQEALAVLGELHKGICGSDSGDRTMAQASNVSRLLLVLLDDRLHTRGDVKNANVMPR